MFDRAALRAKELDEILATTGEPMYASYAHVPGGPHRTDGLNSGPLHGVPVSLKDQFDIKDVELTMGYAAYLGRISPENSALVDLLEANGAIIYVRTNVPQTLMVS